MLEVIDFGVAQIDKREKALLQGRTLSSGTANDQDRYTADPTHGIFAIADGVASTPHSQLAAKAVCKMYLTEQLSLKSDNQDSFKDTTARLLGKLHATALRYDTATTFTGMTISNDTLHYLHVGDTSLMIRRGDDLDIVTTEQVVSNSRRNMLYNYLGYCGFDSDRQRQPTLAPEANHPNQHLVAQAEWGVRKLLPGDRILLMSDGVLGDYEQDRLSSSEIISATTYALGAYAAALSLINVSRKIDDTTALVIDIASGSDSSISPLD